MSTILSFQDSQLKVLSTHVKQADYLETLQDFTSPLDYSQELGELL